MSTDPITESSLVPLKVIRTETVLSRLPIHNLSKKGSFDIQIVRRNKKEEVELKWEVSHSAKYGPPRQLAYKLDTLIINRKIDETGRPVPRLLRLGSLRDLARELNLGGDTNSIRKALRQNAFTGITARLIFRGANGSERRIEADFTRYSVVFAGELLPDGKAADSVYIVLNDPYLDVVNNAPVRPLNYDYLKELSPAAQRFYEIVSFKIFAALKNGLSQAKLAYSEFCTYSPQQRYFDYDHFKKQMYKVHRLHIASGYLESAKYKECRDQNGKVDWMMLYVPGPKAKAEFAAFERPNTLPPVPGKTSLPFSGSLFELQRRGISEAQSAALLKNAPPDQPITEQLEWADQLIARSRGKIHNPPGFYVYVVKENLRPPHLLSKPMLESGSPLAEDTTGPRQDYERFCELEIEKNIATRFSEPVIEELIEAKKKEIRAQFPSARFWSPEALLQLARTAVRSELARGVALPDFTEFQSRK